MKGEVAIVTAAAYGFRARARVLVRSLRRFHPDVEVLALSVTHADLTPSAFAGATIVRLGELAIPNLPGLLFRYSCRELAIAAKPFLLAHALDRGFASVLFLDADMWTLSDLDRLLMQVRLHPLTLSPHRLSPAATAEEELRLLRSGTFNGGLVGVSEGPARRFLAWWQARVHADCRMAPEAGLHHDQRWLDLAPGFVEDLAIVADPGVNVAYWNLDERPLHQREGRWYAGPDPLQLFHFSGFDAGNVSRMSAHSRAEPDRAAAPLFAEYADRVVAEAGLAHDAEEEHEVAHLVDEFANTVPIPEIARRLYGATPGAATFGAPTDCGSGSFYRWLLEPAVRSGGSAGDAVTAVGAGGTAGGEGCPLPRIWLEIHRARPDLQRAFAAPCGRDHARFVAWTHRHGQGEYGLDRAFLPLSEGVREPS